jgi:hypothetical protein
MTVLKVVRFFVLAYVGLLIAGFLIAVSGVAHAKDLMGAAPSYPYQGKAAPAEEPSSYDNMSPIERDRAMGNIGNHGIGHEANHDWYRKLRSPKTNYSCCNGEVGGVEGDCRPTRAYEDENGMWHAMVDGKYVEVPADIILKDPGPDNNNHICAAKSGALYCFIKGKTKL